MVESSKDTGTGWTDPDDAPELDAAWFEGADLYRGDVVVQRGRPRGSAKVSTTVRFDADIIDAFKSDGPGWQTRMNRALREWLERRSAA